MYETRYAKGQWNALCARCGFEYKSSQLHREWTGKRTCRGAGTNGCWEPRHPQDFLQGQTDDQSVPWIQKPKPDVDVSVGSGNEVSRDDL